MLISKDTKNIAKAKQMKILPKHNLILDFETHFKKSDMIRFKCWFKHYKIITYMC